MTLVLNGVARKANPVIPLPENDQILLKWRTSNLMKQIMKLPTKQLQYEVIEHISKRIRDGLPVSINATTLAKAFAWSGSTQGFKYWHTLSQILEEYT